METDKGTQQFYLQDGSDFFFSTTKGANATEIAIL